jgi:soluble lytic murein transglycosylase-like protein
MGKWIAASGVVSATIGFLFLCLLITAVGGRTQQGISSQPTPTASTALPTPASASCGPSVLPDSAYLPLARAAASAVGLLPDLFVRQIQVESGFNPCALSPAGAQGIAQFMPATAAGLGINPWDPVAALRAAARLMASYRQQYQGDYAKALAAYNAGSGTVQQATSACGSQWQACVPLETQHYIQMILGT